MKKRGRLVYDYEANRYTHIADDGTETELHCGDQLTIHTPSGWEETRIEMNADDVWYLVCHEWRDPNNMIAYI